MLTKIVPGWLGRVDMVAGNKVGRYIRRTLDRPLYCAVVFPLGINPVDDSLGSVLRTTAAA